MEKLENKKDVKMSENKAQNIKEEILRKRNGNNVAINNNIGDIQNKKTRNQILANDNTMDSKIDNTGDTKVFQIIRKEDIEREKQKRAIQKENELNNQNRNQNTVSVQNNIKNNNEKNTNKNINDNTGKKNKTNNKKDGKKRKILIALLIFVLLLLVGTICSTIFSLINMNTNKIINHVSINNIDISGNTKEEALEKLQNQLNDSENNKAILKHGDITKEISIADINGKFDIETAVESAYEIGRDKDVLSNNFKTIETMIKGENIDLSFTYDSESIKKKIDEISLELPDLATESTYVIEGNKLIIKNSKDGIKIRQDEFAEKLIKALSGTEKTFEIPVEKAERKEINIDKIHEEIYKEPVNAYFTTNPRQVFKEENGIDFALSMEEIKKVLEEDKPEYEFELKTIKPKITVKNLDSSAFPDLLGTFTTTYGTADTGRNTNIALAAKSINSAVVMPGEVFSYNNLIGECSERTGYKTSTIYLNGELSTGVGGGICQVSTTLYNAVLRANLEIVQRRNHSLGVTYVPAGHDAMVSIGSSDFKFKNNRNYPVKVVAYTGTGSVTCQIYGLKNATEYEVKLETKTLEKTDVKLKVETYKVLYSNGKMVSRTWLSTDTYKLH